ncbi:MAG: efflux RND transporter periplasmic adaptor subunit [Desulfomonilaceae bacterium]|nr:efflux RND transporter periplasmic adaptor subunit [Desulfomonilaceae bacterium]
MRTRILVAIAAGLLISGGLYSVFSRSQPRGTSFRTALVERGPMVSEVSCTGTVNPVMTVKVGAEVTGKIKELFADFNSEVAEGQLIARIDPEPFEARVTQSRADLNVAIANVEIRRAAVERARAELENTRSDLVAAAAQTEKARVAASDAKRELTRMRSLHDSQAIPVRRFEQTEAAHDQAVASLNSARAQEASQVSAVRTREALIKMEVAQIKHAQAQVEHRKAALNDATIELAHTSIHSPVRGVVVSREVDVGETVVARLQAPLLFTIARDPRKMQVETRVDEADIGRIRVGQSAVFTVDTFAGRKFPGVVDQIRKAPHLVQNVVTYTVIVLTDNQDMALLPGMTANVRIVVKQSANAVKVPNAALRFRPRDAGTEAVSGRASTSDPGNEGSPEDRLKRVVETLDMDKDQQAKVWAMYREARERVMGLMAQGSKPDVINEARLAERRRIEKGIEAMLTEDQKGVYRTLSNRRESMENKPGRVWVTDAGGRPVPVDITVGMTDGAFTEVVAGDLKDGRHVIVGMERPTSSDRGLRF